MRAPLSWLREYVDLPADVTPADLAARLTALGLKLEALERLVTERLGDLTPPELVSRVLEGMYYEPTLGIPKQVLVPCMPETFTQRTVVPGSIARPTGSK